MVDMSLCMISHGILSLGVFGRFQSPVSAVAALLLRKEIMNPTIPIIMGLESCKDSWYRSLVLVSARRKPEPISPTTVPVLRPDIDRYGEYRLATVIRFSMSILLYG